MAETPATILIPDISGFTEFMTSTELTHASHAINMLIDAIVAAVGDEYDVSEIEGDAVLLLRKGPAPSKKEIFDTCLNIFNSFHFQRKLMQLHAICPCGACQSIINLTLKFVVHRGPLAEIRVGRFVKHSGTEMIVAHRLLKNSIANNEYLLMTEKLLEESPDSLDAMELQWAKASDEYSSIGKVDYRFALLKGIRDKVPEPPHPDDVYKPGNSSYLEFPIAAFYKDAYSFIMDIPNRYTWVPGLQSVEQEVDHAFVGSVHHLQYDEYAAVISPIKMSVTADAILYAESCRMEAYHLSLIYEYLFRNIDSKSCVLAVRFINTTETDLPGNLHQMLFEKMQQMAEKLQAIFSSK